MQNLIQNESNANNSKKHSSKKIVHPKSSKSEFNSKKKNLIIDKSLNSENISTEESKKNMVTDLNDINYTDRNYWKNINLYRHILETYNIRIKDLEWVLDLRSENHFSSLNKNIIEPHFYKEDLRKFIEKINNNKKILDLIPKSENIQGLYHMLNERSGFKGNVSQVEFECNLRSYNNKNDLSREKIDNNKKNSTWNSIPFIPKSRLFSSYNTENNNKNFSESNNKIISKKKNLKLKEENDIEISNEIKNKTFSNKFGLTTDFLGDNKSFKPYCDKYNERNCNSIRHLLVNTSNAQALFQSGLRDYNVKK